jgi:hypothetical protein
MKASDERDINNLFEDVPRGGSIFDPKGAICTLLYISLKIHVLHICVDVYFAHV